MNPGLIEYMYLKQNISKNHITIEFETDTGVHSDDIFNTWSPETYYTESVKEPHLLLLMVLSNL